MKLSSINIENRFVEFCQENELIHPKDTIIIGVSGGVDSMVLLSLLYQHRAYFDNEIVVLHFNHMLRGVKANNDQKLVEEYCMSRNIEFHFQKMDVMQFARDNKLSFEMAGRNLRYEFFQRIAARYKNSKIATAHILNDQTETILMRIFKGTGLRGLQGIDVKRDNIIRPILFADKTELYQYARENNIPFSDDHTNFENDCLRNIIRNEVIPKIKSEINPNIDKSISKLSVTATEIMDHLKNRLLKILNNIFVKQSSYEMIFEINDLKELDSIERKELLLFCFMKLEKSINSYPGFLEMEQIENLISSSKTGKYVQPFPNIIVERNRKFLHIVNCAKMQWKEIEIIPGKIYPMEFFIFSSKVIRFEEFSNINNDCNIEYIDKGKIKGTLKLRHWQKGDRFQPFGNRYKKKLSDFFIDEKIAKFKKNRIPILVDDEKIIWICGHRLSDEVRITKDSKQILKIKYEEIYNG